MAYKIINEGIVEMQAVNEKLKAYIENSNKDLFDKLDAKMAHERSQVTSQYMDIDEKLTTLKVESEERGMVDGINGDKLPMKDVVRDSHYSIKVIEESIGLWTDLNIIHQKMKKRKLYRIVIPTITVIWFVAFYKILFG